MWYTSPIWEEPGKATISRVINHQSKPLTESGLSGTCMANLMLTGCGVAGMVTDGEGRSGEASDAAGSPAASAPTLPPVTVLDCR